MLTADRRISTADRYLLEDVVGFGGMDFPCWILWERLELARVGWISGYVKLFCFAMLLLFYYLFCISLSLLFIMCLLYFVLDQ